MYNSDTELLFPPRVIQELRDLRGEIWTNLIDRVLPTDSRSHDKLAFVLFMVRLSGCTSCHADSFRALRGCTSCSRQTIRRFRGEDTELIELYRDAYHEIQRELKVGVGLDENDL